MSVKAYRLRIRDAADSSWESTFTSIRFGGIPTARVRLWTGKVESAAWSVEVLDASAAVTAAITDGTNYNILRRLADISVSEDGGAYTVLATGRITDIELSANRAFYRFSVHDERIIERASDLFTTANTTAVWFPGLLSVYRDFDVGPTIERWNPFKIDPRDVTARAIRDARTGDITTVRIEPSGGELPQQVRSVIDNDVLPGMPSIVQPTDIDELGSGCFQYLRLQMGGTDFHVVGFVYAWEGPSSEQVGWQVGKSPTENLTEGPSRIALYDPTNAVVDSDAVYLHLLNAPPTKEAPLHIDTTDIGTLIKAIYAGDYGGEVVKADTTTALGTYNASTNPTGLIDNPKYPQVAFRIEDKANMARWLEQNIYAPFGIMPLVNAAGELQPTPFLLPAADQVANVSTLFAFTAANSRLVMGHVFKQSSADQVTVLEGEWLEEQRGDMDDVRSGTAALDRLRVAPKKIERETDNVDAGELYGKQVKSYRLHGLHSPDEAASWMDRMRVEVGDRFEHGVITTKVEALSAAQTPNMGAYVTIDFDSYPDVDGTRGAFRLQQVIGMAVERAVVVYTLMDAGPKEQPLSAPTVAVAVKGKNTLRVTMGSVSAGEGWLLQAAKSVSEPAESSALWRQVTTGTSSQLIVDVGGLASGTVYWFRAQKTKLHRIRSLWATAASGTTTAMTPPTIVSLLNITDTTAVVRFTVGEQYEPVQILLDGVLIVTLPPGSKLYKFTNLTPSTSYALKVQHVDAYGGVAADTDTLVTIATGGALTKPYSIQIVTGANIGTRFSA